MNMKTPLLFIALCALPTTPESLTDRAQAQILSKLGSNRIVVLEIGAEVETLKNATAQLLEELSIVRSRQAASSAVQAFMALAFLAYLATIAVCYLVKRCKKHQQEVAKAEFELLEANLRSSKARRRAAAAQEKSAQAHSLE